MIFELGGVSYPSKKAAIADVRRILQQAEPRTFLEDTDFEIVLSTLQLHPLAVAKIGAGVTAIMVDTQELPPFSRVFRVHRADNTTATFSYLKCFYPARSSQKASVLAAMRRDVKDQVISVKAWYFEVEAVNGRCYSPVENQWLLPAESDIDHYPVSFSTIARQFVEKHFNGRWDAIQTRRVEVGFGDTISDPGVRSLWQDWHESQAQYRVISRDLNVRLGQHDRKVS